MAVAGADAKAAVQGLHGDKQAFENLVLSCNKDGMEALRKGQSKAAFEQFKYAESILIANQAGNSQSTNLMAVTCNNMGCYYKKVGKLHGALSYLRRALQMEVDLNSDEVTVAGTHLNICAILSKLEKHEKAVSHALSALELINRRVSDGDPLEVPQDDYAVLAIAYHNVAVERDFLQQFDKAAAAFQQGHLVAKRCLGEDHPLAITLGRNCDAVLFKSQRLTKVAPRGASQRLPAKDMDLAGFTGGLDDAGRGATLPALPGAQKRDVEDSPMPRSARQDTAAWVAGEEIAWSNFARSTLVTGEALQSSSPASNEDLALPKFRDTGRRDIPFSSVPPPPLRMLEKKTPFAQAIESFPQNVMDIIEADRTGLQVRQTVRGAPNDCRPNRMIKGSTRTARVLERTSALSTTIHRDKVVQSRWQPSPANGQKTAWIRKIAAERIQRAWRSWYTYCQLNADWMTTTFIAATMIQANWRSYHVRRLKLDRAATCIQRRQRGVLVRSTRRKHRAAVTIQRHAVGMLTRMQMQKLHRAAVKMQALMRGGLGRRRARGRRHHLTQTVMTIQCAVRCHLARRRVQAKRAEANTRKAKSKGAMDIQRIFRGAKGRARADAARVQYHQDMLKYRAATKLQAMVRRDGAIKRVDRMRAQKFDQMNKAATYIRKMWLGARTRKRHKTLMAEYARHVEYIAIMQRYSRGFLVRLRMWRQAIRAEEQLWGALEIQRVWRGYRGRVQWEARYEQVWRREMAAALIGRNIRGWVARCKVKRVRRKIARAEFERARRRFRAAQKLQALARGVLVRKVFLQRFSRCRHAAVQIQRIARGHALRDRLLRQVILLRAIKIQAAMRGCLVRRRRMHLIAKVICIQRHWRQHLRKPPELRQRGLAQMRERKQQAIVIQKKFREHQEGKEIARIQSWGSPA